MAPMGVRLVELTEGGVEAGVLSLPTLNVPPLFLGLPLEAKGLATGVLSVMRMDAFFLCVGHLFYNTYPINQCNGDDENR